jgi:ubiquinone/menaquinone biosynthesis C-methylase UbiE
MDHLEGYDKYDFVAEFYDYVVPYRDRQDVTFFVEMAQHSAGPVLEIGCGTGRVLIPTAKAGIEIVGLDSSSSMLSVCRERLSREPAEVQSRVQLVQGDMRQFDLGRMFDLVTIPYRPFEHLITIEDQLSCLASIHRHLVRGGRLTLDVFNPDLSSLVEEQYLVEGREEPEFTTPDGHRVVRRHRTVSRDLFNQVQDLELIYYITYPDGHQERLVHH